MTNLNNAHELKSCPFCGSTDIDRHGWYDGNGHRGPECMGCGATASTPDAWNRRSQLAAEERAEKAEAKLAAIGRLSPTDYDDREALLGALFRILRGQFGEEEEMES